MAKSKFYAVKIGREGPNIYTSWDDCKANTMRWPGAVHKSFTSRNQAEQWLTIPHPSAALYTSPTMDEDASILSGPSNTTAVPPRHNPAPRPEPPPATPNAPASGVDPGPKPSPEQQAVLARVKAGHSVFFTGSAGTGKSFLLGKVVEHLTGQGGSTDAVAITASTGIAGVNIGGRTIHSWAGIGTGEGTAKNMAGKILGQKKCEPVRHRWYHVRALILDEISMIDGVLFDKLEEMARIIRRNDKPFGGIQLIISGDFAQLPPVPGNDGVARFAFESKSWERCVGKPVLLQKVFRQRDQTFVDMLNAMRFGKLDQRTVDAFKALSRHVQYHDGIEPTELYPTRSQVGIANEQRLKQLAGEAHIYVAMDTPGEDETGKLISEDQAARMLNKLVAPQEIVLKVGAQVMLIKNLHQGQLVNGSLGQVIDFCTPQDAQRDHTEISSENPALGAPGSATHNAAPQAQQQQSRGDPSRVWPLVRFTNGRTLLCTAADFTVLNGVGEVEARRDQVPLILAWALSVHKSQGQTLERVRVDLGRTFEKGQAYVALSRATRLDQLQVLNFNAGKVMAHPRVLGYYNSLTQPDEWDEFDELDDEMIAEYQGGRYM